MINIFAAEELIHCCHLISFSIAHQWNHWKSYFLLRIEVILTAIFFSSFKRDGGSYGAPIIRKHSVGRAVYIPPVRLWDKSTGKVADFETVFTFVVDSAGSQIHADGLSFFIIPFDADPSIPKNSSGGYLGLFTPETAFNVDKNQIVAIEFDSFGNDWDPKPVAIAPHIGVDINSLESVETIDWPINAVPEGLIGEASIRYDSEKKELHVAVGYGTQPPTIVQLSETIDLSGVLPEWSHCCMDYALICVSLNIGPSLITFLLAKISVHVCVHETFFFMSTRIKINIFAAEELIHCCHLISFSIAHQWNHWKSYFLLRIEVILTAIFFSSFKRDGGSYGAPIIRKHSVGRAVYIPPVRLWDKSTGKVADFETVFTFVVDSAGSQIHADGLSFFIIPFDADPSIPKNSSGGYLGLFTPETAFNVDKNQIVAIEFDSFGNDWDPKPVAIAPHIGVDINSLESVETIDWPINAVPEGLIGEASIRYDSEKKELHVAVGYGTQPPTIVQLSETIDLSGVLPEWVRIGFSGATGDSVETHDILSWTFGSRI
ncbi:hypothetical protein DEO72_LG2g2282 [Vigna unguiculata]|uniref:Legume lectin domain-containing protein n=1 Tax=Vigna unguiculata TaxID=3917 RepID=A0A4D6KY52_VIGUN|nr:hypothetical protein DEO72_LG2g2282 [Vigna unguiculata]